MIATTESASVATTADPARLSNPRAQARGRNQQIDVLRGVAILLVLGRHHPYYGLWHRAGWIGVDLFFVLSGFLISGLLFAEYKSLGEINFRRFFIRRGFKIYPAYYCFLLLTLPVSLREIKVSDLTFMQSYFPGFWRHTWSLSIEEHFYLALPLMLILSYKLMPKLRFAWIPYAFPCLVAACLFMRVRQGAGASMWQVISPTHLRMDALFAGVTLSWFYHFRPGSLRLSRPLWIGLLGTALCSTAFFYEESDYWMYTAGLSALLLGFSCILVWAINTPQLQKLKLISAIGLYSYSIYLWHFPVAKIFEALFPVSFIGFWNYVAVTIAMGVAMAKAIENPSLRLRDRYFPSVRSPLDTRREGLSLRHS